MDDEPLLRRLHDLAAGQDGCVSVTQLDASEISYDTVKSLVRRGALARVVTGVYVIQTRALSDRQAMRAALLVAGDGAALSHFTAAALHGLMEAQPDDVWVTAPGRRNSRTLQTLIPVASTGSPATIHIVGTRSASHTALVRGLPTSEPAGALVELASRVYPTPGIPDRTPRRRGGPDRAQRGTRRQGLASVDTGRRVPATVVARAWREADYLNLLRDSAVQRELGRGITGSTLIRHLQTAHPIVSDDATDVATRSEFLLLTAVLRLGLPRPLTNQLLRLPGASYFPDQFWIDVGLVVEVDGGVHRRPSRRAADQARDEHMRANGLTVLRFSNDAVDADADACALAIAREYTALSQRASA